jgi:hypothetical protein
MGGRITCLRARGAYRVCVGRWRDRQGSGRGVALLVRRFGVRKGIRSDCYTLRDRGRRRSTIGRAFSILRVNMEL